MTADEWNARYPVGTIVARHTLIGGPPDERLTHTRSEAWVASSGDHVVLIGGQAGYHLLEALTPFDRVCPTCGSQGFAESKLGPERCGFCDGTEGGNPP